MLLNRLYERKLGYLIGVGSYAVDVYLVYQLTLLISQIDEYQFLGIGGVQSAVVILLIRILATVILKLLSYRLLYSKKNREVRLVINQMLVKYRKTSISNDEVNVRREQVITSTEIALVNFDIPFFQLLGELLVFIFIIFVVYGMLEGIVQTLPIIPIVILLCMLCFSIYISSKLGKINIDNNKQRLRVVTDVFNNIGYYSINHSDANVDKNIDNVDSRYNNINSMFSVFNSSNMIFVETMVLVVLASIITFQEPVDINQMISSAPLLLRIVPSITRIASMLPQINFGLAAVRRLNVDI